MTPFDQAHYDKYAGSFSLHPRHSSSDANKKPILTWVHVYRILQLAMVLVTFLPGSGDANQRPYSTEENNHLLTSHFCGTSVPVSKNYFHSKSVADVTRSGNHRQFIENMIIFVIV